MPTAPVEPSEKYVASMLSSSALLALIGGYLDGFTYVGHGHVFANAMTGNVVLLAVSLLHLGDGSIFRHLPPIISFFFGVSAAKAVGFAWRHGKIRYPYLTVLLFEIIGLTAIGLLPNHTPDFWITISIAFVSSVQVQTFREVNGHAFNTTFTTGNLRTLSENLFDWIFAGRSAASLGRIRDFSLICLAFFVGAGAGGFAVTRFGNPALWFDSALLFVVFLRIWPSRDKQIHST